MRYPYHATLEIERVLADKVSLYLDSPISAMYGPQSVRAFQRFDERVRKAARFDIQRDAIFLIENLAQTVMPSRIIDALGLCRLPHPLMWIEFNFKDRQDWKDIASKAGIYHQRDWDAYEQPEAPGRIGFLLEDDSDDTSRGIIVHLVSESEGTFISPCVRSFRFDTTVRPPERISDAEVVEAMSMPTDNAWTARWKGKREEERASVDLEHRIETFIPEHTRAVWEAAAEGGPALVEQLNLSSLYDLAGEWKFILSLLMVLNSRNVVQYDDEVSYERLNKQRARKGKPPLLSHRPVTIHLSRAQHGRMGTMASVGGGGRGDIRGHLVRGHWKLRRSGLFFWSHHSRGDETNPSSYRVFA